MPKKNNKQKGGQVDITRYTKPCSTQNQLPLDGLFMKHFPQSGGCGCAMQMGGSIRAGSEVRPYIGAQKGAGKKVKNQKGKGYTILPDSNIGNRAEVKGYPDWAPPVVTNKGMMFSSNMKPLCGQQIGGKKSKHNVRKMKSKKSTHSKRKMNNKRKITKRRKTSNKKYKKQRGGVVKGMSDVNGNFSGDMSTRTFGCRQPMWNPNCV